MKRGFTLIELMLVVIIIGILAAMVMPRLVGRSDEARTVAAQADINATLGLALDMYEMDNGAYPEKLEDLRVNPGNVPKWKGPYLKKEPKDPWGRAYQYERDANAKDYKVCSSGPDASKQDDDICNK